MTTPTETFDTRFAQLCEAFEKTTQGEYGFTCVTEHDGSLKKILVGSTVCGPIAQLKPIRTIAPKDGAPLALSMYEQETEADAEWFALAHNFFPAIKEEMARLRNKGCECACHSFPEHAKLQDIAEANRFHIDKLRDAQATIESQASELTEARARIESLERKIKELNP